MFRWIVASENTLRDAAIDIHKTVSWSDVSNATVAVTTYSSPETQGDSSIPNVLFIGTACHSHSLTTATVVESLNTVAKRANVDWYLTSDTSATLNGTMKSGSIEHGDEIEASDLGIDVSGGGTQYANEAAVAEFLKPYYEKNAVIQIIDDYNSQTAMTGNNAEIWNKTVEGPYTYWCPNTFFYSSNAKRTSATEFRALIGLMAPQYYDANMNSLEYLTSNSYAYRDVVRTMDRYTYSANMTHYALPRYENQTYYNYVTNVIDMLERVSWPTRSTKTRAASGSRSSCRPTALTSR